MLAWRVAERRRIAVLEVVALGSDANRGREVAARLGGIAYGAPDDAPDIVAFRSLVRVVTDDLDALAPAADRGRYIVFRRVMRAETIERAVGQQIRGVVAIFGFYRHPSLSHSAADTHWRDVHAPLALRHHPGMCDYLQASVVAALEGPSYDGFAFCKFPSERDLRERFFDSKAGRQVILDDVAKFADRERSPRAVEADHWDFTRVGDHE